MVLLLRLHGSIMSNFIKACIYSGYINYYMPVLEL